MRRSVVFPQPLGPRIVRISCVFTSMSMSSRTCREPNHFPTPLRRSVGFVPLSDEDMDARVPVEKAALCASFGWRSDSPHE